MNINIKDTIILEDNKQYAVASKINYQNKTYYYLVDIHDCTNIKFCYQDDNELVEEDNNEIITGLLPLFYQKAVDVMPELFQKGAMDEV